MGKCSSVPRGRRGRRGRHHAVGALLLRHSGQQASGLFGRCDHSPIPSITINCFVEASTFIQDSALSLHRGVEVARSFPSTDNEGCCSLLHCLLAISTPLCEACEAIKDVFHILWSCPLYTSYRDVPAVPADLERLCISFIVLLGRLN